MDKIDNADEKSIQNDQVSNRQTQQTQSSSRLGLIRNHWVVLILGLFFIVLLIFVVLLLLYTHMSWFQAVILLSCVAYFPLTYLAYQLRSERHKQRIVDDFRLLGLVREGEEKLVEKQYQGIHSPQQYIIYVTLAALVTLLGFGLFYFNLDLPFNLGEIETGGVALVMFYSFLGAFVFSIFNVYRRYVTFDLQPGVYLYVVVMMLTVMVVAFILAEFLNNLELSYMIPVVAFLLGYLPDAGIRFITSLASRVTGRITRNETGLGSIDGISIWHETRLRESGIDNTQNLQACDVRELLLSSRFSAQQLMNWIDQAILINNVSSAVLKELNQHSIRTITAFVSLVDNRDFESLPVLPPDVISEALQDTPQGVQVEEPPGDEDEVADDQSDAQSPPVSIQPGEYPYKNLRALYQAIYHTADTSPNYHYVNRYWKAVKRFRVRQIDTALEQSLTDLGIKVVESLLLEPDMIEQMGRAWKELELPHEVLPNLFPDTVQGKVALGNLYVELDRFPDAMDAFEDAISEDPNYAQTFASRGLAFSIQRRFSEAFADFNKAKKLAPDYAVTYHHEGVTHMKRGRFEEAIESLSTAIQKDRKYAYAYFNRGRAYSLLENFNRAQEDFTKAINLKKMPRAYFERGVIFTYKVMVREAIEDFSSAIQIDSKDAKSYAWRGFAYMLYGDHNHALYDLDTAIDFDPKLAVAYAYRGQLNFQMEDEESAVEDYTKSLELDPRQARVCYNRSLAYQKMGRLEDAIEDQREYLRLAPQAQDHQAVIQRIAKLEEQLQEEN